jgi:hypothetical protein
MGTVTVRGHYHCRTQCRAERVDKCLQRWSSIIHIISRGSAVSEEFAQMTSIRRGDRNCPSKLKPGTNEVKFPSKPEPKGEIKFAHQKREGDSNFCFKTAQTHQNRPKRIKTKRR